MEAAKESLRLPGNRKAGMVVYAGKPRDCKLEAEEGSGSAWPRDPAKVQTQSLGGVGRSSSVLA